MTCTIRFVAVARTVSRSTSRTSPREARCQRGVTAIELMVVLAVLAILVTVAAPSFIDLTQRNRVATEINGFVGDLQFARAEAIRRGQNVTLCASTNGTSCGGTTWNNGWLIFNNGDPPDTTIDTGIGETVIRKQAKWSSTDTFTATDGLAVITYSRDGFALGLPSGAVQLTLNTSPANAKATRCVLLNLAGRQQVLTAGGTCS
ncbi:GspH/FimT family pseudopilin [Variovorax rhizosphaerae]|uniref:Type II secretion system protein H n=1 Tax=Variovorax rhizosphaerae TaxID=1836200 RepID=A0ABU8WHB6_9BURK